jgi:hypothetical protein
MKPNDMVFGHEKDVGLRRLSPTYRAAWYTTSRSLHITVTRNETDGAKRDDPAGQDIHHPCGRRSSAEYVKHHPAFIIAPLPLWQRRRGR